MFIVPEIFGHRQRGEAHAETAAWWLIHLAINHHHVWQHAGFFHLAVKLLAFAAALTDATKNAHPFLMANLVVNHLRKQYRLAHARPAEKSRLTAAFQRHQHINDLDARFKNLRLGGTPRQGRRIAMHGTPLDIRRRRLTVNGVAKHIEHSRENGFADWRLQWPARVGDRHAARQTLGRRQGNPAHVARIALSQHLDDDLFFRPRVKHRVDRRQRPVKPHIHDAAAHRRDHPEIG